MSDRTYKTVHRSAVEHIKERSIPHRAKKLEAKDALRVSDPSTCRIAKIGSQPRAAVLFYKCVRRHRIETRALRSTCCTSFLHGRWIVASVTRTLHSCPHQDQDQGKSGAQQLPAASAQREWSVAHRRGKGGARRARFAQEVLASLFANDEQGSRPGSLSSAQDNSAEGTRRSSPYGSTVAVVRHSTNRSPSFLAESAQAARRDLQLWRRTFPRQANAESTRGSLENAEGRGSWRSHAQEAGPEQQQQRHERCAAYSFPVERQNIWS